MLQEMMKAQLMSLLGLHHIADLLLTFPCFCFILLLVLLSFYCFCFIFFTSTVSVPYHVLPMYVMHLTQLIISGALTCFVLVYALVPCILIENVTPIDDICNFTYPLHCGQPFTDNNSGANEIVHEVPFYIHTCSSYMCFMHLF
jgi:hypothetical protein